VVRAFPLALAAFVLLPGCGGASSSEKPAVRGNGIEERTYGSGADQVWVTRPTQRDVESVVVYVHGHGGPQEDTPSFHRPWLQHLARKGSAVIYPRYEDFPGGHGTLAHIERAVDRAMDELDVGDDVPIVGIGYSRGGRLVMDWAAAGVGGEFEPDALLSVFPASGEDPEENLALIRHATKIVVLVGDQDEVVGDLGAIALMQQLTVPGVPDPNRRVELVRSTKSFTANHLSVLETTPGARAAFWDRADRLIATVRAR
jgi:pimeloyl-ACP methyl ester carboxylesterase